MFRYLLSLCPSSILLARSARLQVTWKNRGGLVSGDMIYDQKQLDDCYDEAETENTNKKGVLVTVERVSRKSERRLSRSLSTRLLTLVIGCASGCCSYVKDAVP
jgi:hypothetical protein